MTHEVVITGRAQQEAEEHHDWWAKHRSADQAARWYDAFLRAADSLEQTATRYPLAIEDERFPNEVRQLNFGIGRHPTHRILYTIREPFVVVLRVRHLAQDSVD